MRRETTAVSGGGSAELKKLGAQLKALREAQGQSYENVAEVTHVRPRVIQSIENGTIEDETAAIYARGFIKTYCEYLMAPDLWKKYSQGVSIGDDAAEEGPEITEERPEIIHPTRMFKRSSIIWVYMILLAAVLGAAYLLWNQYRDPGHTEDAFSLRFPSVSSADAIVDKLPVSADFSPAPASDDTGVVSAGAASGDAPAVPVPEPKPQSADSSASLDNGTIAPGDLSWMDSASASARPVEDLPRFVDMTLLIEITGSNTRLTVEQDRKTVTKRTLGIGGRRSYDVTKDTRITLSAGNKARVTWLGKRYESIGADNNPLSLIFRPDGTVTLVSGKTPHFGPAPEPEPAAASEDI